MEDGILDEFLRQVIAGVYTEFEVGVLPIAKEPFAMLDEGKFAEESASIGEFDGDRWQGPGKETGVILIKAGLYVIDSWNHTKVQRYNKKMTCARAHAIF